MPPELKVTARYARLGINGVRLMCVMSDGSVWECDSNGRKCKQELFSDTELERSHAKKDED